MVKRRLLAVLIVALGTTAACSADPSSPGVPTLSGSNAADNHDADRAGNNLNAANGDGSTERRTKLHAAAQCIREHGAPNYQDPVLTADGRVYTDVVSLRDVDDEKLEAIQTACGELIRAANFTVDDQAPPPPALVQAGVRSAECLRANGLPNVKDPTANSQFVPGKGFGLDPDGIPAGGKGDPTVQRALAACRRILDEEASASSLGNLAHA
jgi:hypothetical protein